MIDCTVAWTTSSADDPDYCWPEEQAEMQAAMPAARTGLAKAIDEVRAVMAGAGYSAAQWKFVLMGYSSPIPNGADIRYSESGWSRLSEGGCPFWNADADWARNWAVPFMNDNMKDIGAQKGVQVLDLRSALDGRQVCHRNSSPRRLRRAVGDPARVGALAQLRLLPGRVAGVAAPERLRAARDGQMHRADVRGRVGQPDLPQHPGPGGGGDDAHRAVGSQRAGRGRSPQPPAQAAVK